MQPHGYQFGFNADEALTHTHTRNVKISLLLQLAAEMPCCVTNSSDFYLQFTTQELDVKNYLHLIIYFSAYFILNLLRTEVTAFVLQFHKRMLTYLLLFLVWNCLKQF